MATRRLFLGLVVAWNLLWATPMVYLGAVGWLFFHGCTNDAPAYSERAFDQVRPGMSIVELEALLGQPLEIDCYAAGLFLRTLSLRAGSPKVTATTIDPWQTPGHVVYSYSERSPLSDSYFVRTIALSGEGVVKGAYGSFYSD